MTSSCEGTSYIRQGGHGLALVNKQYLVQLDFAREQAQLWAHLSPQARAEQIDAHLESEFGVVLPGVVEEASR